MLIGLAAALGVWKQPWSSARIDPIEAFPDNAPSLLTRQTAALGAARTTPEFVAAAGGTPAARNWARQVLDARSRLGVGSVAWSYVRGGTARDRSDGSGLAVIHVTWRAGRAQPASADVGLRVRPHGGMFEIVSVERVRDAVPLWLAGDIETSANRGVDLISVNGGGRLQLRRQLEMARAAVRRIVPDSGGVLTVVAPKSARESAALLGINPADIDQIAAVTTTLAGAVRAIVLNPDQFAHMDAHARQVVLTHEATHLLTGAVHGSGAGWVVEGFADWVALHDDPYPPAINAQRALDYVREHGVPQHLPAAAEFSNETQSLGSLYELTWLLFSMLARQHGEPAVLAFYREVVRGADLDTALARDLRTDQPTVLRDWQRALDQMVGR